MPAIYRRIVSRSRSRSMSLFSTNFANPLSDLHSYIAFVASLSQLNNLWRMPLYSCFHSSQSEQMKNQYVNQHSVNIESKRVIDLPERFITWSTTPFRKLKFIQIVSGSFRRIQAAKQKEIIKAIFDQPQLTSFTLINQFVIDNFKFHPFWLFDWFFSNIPH